MAVEILNSNLGVSYVLPATGEQTHLPDSKDFVSVGQEVHNLEEMFSKDLQEKMLFGAIKPHIDRPEQYDPGHISLTMDNVCSKLARVEDKYVSTFVNEVLTPLDENRQLLKVYSDMMMGG